ncbi:hypothetical protein AAE478_000054 [Parahypoxylon ruwenzoriense]
MAKSVCIVGAGPSGLVAAKTLLHDAPAGSFKVTIFEAQPRIGGLWPTRRDDNDGLLHPLMVANQSKHTVQFSDFAWRDSDPEFPRAWQVGQYLERYLNKYGGSDMRLGHKVVAADLQGDCSWKVHVESSTGSETGVFDYLLITTGFFGHPIWPDYVPREAEVPIIHSSKYRDIRSLLAKSNRRGGKILVVGGQMSGIEIAATIATHVSSATHSPGEKIIEEPEKYSIHHVIHRPSWVFPLFTSPKGHISLDAARLVNSIYRSFLGTDQSEFSPETKIGGDLLDEQPLVAMSSWYTDFVRSGLIKISQGKLSSFSGNVATLSPTNERISDIAAVVLATGFDPGPSLSFLPPSVLETISYSPSHPNLPTALAFHGTHHSSLPTLGFVGFYRSQYWGVMEMQARLVAHLWTHPPPSQSPELQQALAADDSIARTLALRADSRVSQFPMGDYAFLMQEFARALNIQISPFGSTPPLANGKSMDVLTPARYSSATQIQNQSQRKQIEANLRSTRDTAVAGLSRARFVAGAVFRSLLGEWRLERDLISRLPSHPSGRFVGTARFLLREGTADGRSSVSRNSSPSCPTGNNINNDGIQEQEQEQDPGLEYLYIEDGTFTARDNPSLSFRATRRYIWRYDEARDVLSVWFARTDDASRADYLFHEVEFLVPGADTDAVAPATPGIPGGISGGGAVAAVGETNKVVDEGESKKGWLARASHLCVEDLYDVHYEFNFRSVNLKEWKLGYTVRGPKKDYSIDGVYRR